jgi:hypothetical protein
MKKIIISIMCALFILPAIAGTPFMKKALDSWLGYNINNMINHWGFPTEEKKIANRHIYVWNRSYTQYVPQQTNSTVNSYIYNANITSKTTGGYYITYSCNTTIEVDSQNNIISWFCDDNGCPQNYYFGKQYVNPANDEWQREKIKKMQEKQKKELEKKKNKKTKKDKNKKEG